MTHKERQALIRKPFPTFRVFERHTYADTYIRDVVPTEGRRVFHPSPDDEEYYAKVNLEDIE